MGGQLWEVVGGAKTGGIFVRMGKDTTSPPCPRLATGAIVEQVRLEDGRLFYLRLYGKGPNAGWVSVRLSDGKELLARTERKPPTEEPRPPPSPVEGRRLRLLLVHGAKANSNVMKFQTSPLKKLMGKDVEWLTVEGPLNFDDYVKPNETEETDPLHCPPTEIEKTLAGKLPLKQWYTHGNATFSLCEKGADHLRRQIEEMLPVDGIVAYSQGACQVTMLINYLRTEGVKELPWRLNVFISGGQIDDPKYQFTESFAGPYAVPTVRVYNGLPDPYFGGASEPTLAWVYPDIIEMTHMDGHGFPRTEPHAGEIWQRIVDEIHRWLPVKS